jgi:hypothetical protein
MGSRRFSRAGGARVSDKALEIYLNDHFAGAMLGSDLAKRIRDRHEGTRLGDVMGSIATEIEQDRQTLVDLMDRMAVSRNRVKQATGWVAEKASRVKFGGLLSGAPEQGAFMALESLALGVEGKACLWRVLKEVAAEYPPLASTDFDELITRAESQHTTLERERLEAGRHALQSDAVASRR